MPTNTTYSTLVTDFQRYLERGDSAINDPRVFDQIPRLINLAERHLARRLKVQLAEDVVRSTMIPGVSEYAKPTGWRDTVSIRFGAPRNSYRTVSRSSIAGTRTLVLSEPHAFTVGQQVVISGVGSSSYNGSFPLASVTQLSITYVTGSLTETSTADAEGRASSLMNVTGYLYPRSYEYCRNSFPDDSARGRPGFYADYNVDHWLIAGTPDLPYPYEVKYHRLPPMLDESNQTNVWTEYAPEALLYGTLLEATPFLKNDERISVWQGMYDKAVAEIRGEDVQKMIDRSAARTGA